MNQNHEVKIEVLQWLSSRNSRINVIKTSASTYTKKYKFPSAGSGRQMWIPKTGVLVSNNFCRKNLSKQSLDTKHRGFSIQRNALFLQAVFANAARRVVRESK